MDNIRKIFVLRVIETILLATFVTGLEISKNRVSWDFSILSLNFGFSIMKPDAIVLSSTIFGFAMSLLASLQQKKMHDQWLRASFVFSTLGIISYSNEILRLIVGHNFQLLLTFPIPLLIFDWMAYFKLKKITSNQQLEPTCTTPLD